MVSLIMKARVCYQLCLTLYGGLIITLLIKTWWLDPPQSSQWFATCIQLLPLLLPLAGLLGKRPTGAAWLCFILCFYFVSGVVAVWVTPSEIHEWVITGLSCSLFVTAMFFTRWQGRLLKGKPGNLVSGRLKPVQ